MAGNISHDLYQLQRGRWTLAQQYAEQDKDGAVRKAREMFASGQYDAVGVMRERYDPGTGASHGTLVYSNAKTDDVPNLHGRVVKPEAAQRRERPQGPRFDDGDGEFDETPARGAAAARSYGQDMGPSASTVFGKFIMLFTISFLLAVGTWFILSRFGLDGSLSDMLGERDLPLKVIILCFFIFCVIVGPTIITGRDLQAIFYSSDGEPSPRRSAGSATPKRSLLGRRAASRAQADDEEDDDDEDEDDDDEDEDDEEDAAPEPKLDKETVGKLTGARETMVAFFELCLRFINDAELPTKTGKLDPLMTFGCHLYFAGAAEVLCQVRGLPPAVLAKVLEPCVIAMGRKPEQARSFVERYDEYLLEPSYNEMFRVGREAMEAYVVDERKAAKQNEGDEEGDEAGTAAAQAPTSDDWENETDIGIFLLHALEDFATPASRKEKKKADGGTMAVMFTYIVGLGDVTQEHGEGVGRRIAGVHDTVVRQAIRDENGREIKHTGEGIMAAFDASGDAVAAAITMQRGFNEYNLGDADIPLHVKIGVNAGEPIVEGTISSAPPYRSPPVWHRTQYPIRYWSPRWCGNCPAAEMLNLLAPAHGNSKASPSRSRCMKPSGVCLKGPKKHSTTAQKLKSGYPSNGSCTRIVSSRSGLVDRSATGTEINSSMRRMYLTAVAGRSAQLRPPWVLSRQPSMVS